MNFFLLPFAIIATTGFLCFIADIALTAALAWSRQWREERRVRP